ncbi:uncharacterized protein [Primulina huaijiensis]|uniref:uncharacterized protein n=1 Tax=Primulina huaijiensis TaxID=1492673 RepID=UPI003CC7787F
MLTDSEIAFSNPNDSKMGEEAENDAERIFVSNTTPTRNSNPNSITPSQFLAWKRRKDADASARKAEAARKRAEDIAAGLVQMNGRELFVQEPWVFDNSRY